MTVIFSRTKASHERSGVEIRVEWNQKNCFDPSLWNCPIHYKWFTGKETGSKDWSDSPEGGVGPPQSPVVTVPLGREVVAGWRSGASEIFPEIFYRKQTSGVYERVLHSYAALSFIGLTMRGRGKRKLKINIWEKHDCQGWEKHGAANV